MKRQPTSADCDCEQMAAELCGLGEMTITPLPISDVEQVPDTVTITISDGPAAVARGIDVEQVDYLLTRDSRGEWQGWPDGEVGERVKRSIRLHSPDVARALGIAKGGA